MSNKSNKSNVVSNVVRNDSFDLVEFVFDLEKPHYEHKHPEALTPVYGAKHPDPYHFSPGTLVTYAGPPACPNWSPRMFPHLRNVCADGATVVENAVVQPDRGGETVYEVVDAYAREDSSACIFADGWITIRPLNSSRPHLTVPSAYFVRLPEASQPEPEPAPAPAPDLRMTVKLGSRTYEVQVAIGHDGTGMSYAQYSFYPGLSGSVAKATLGSRWEADASRLTDPNYVHRYVANYMSHAARGLDVEIWSLTEHKAWRQKAQEQREAEAKLLPGPGTHCEWGEP